MSQYRIQRKFTGESLIKLRHQSTIPQRIKSLQNKYSYQKSPKKTDQESLKKIVKRFHFKAKTENAVSKAKMEEGMKAYKEKNVGQALEIFKQIQKAGQKSAELSFYIGSCYLNIGKNQLSIRNLNECLAQNQQYSPNAYLYIAVNFKMLGNHRQALKILQEGTSIFPQFEEAHFYKAKLSMKIGQMNQAIQAFKKCLQINSMNDLATIFMADCLKNIGKQDLALQKYKQIAKKGKKYNNLAVVRLSSILASRRDYTELLSYLLKARQKGIQSPEINYYLGICSCELGNKRQGIVYLQTALNNSQEANIASKALKALIKICIEQSNFIQAEYHLNRISKFGLNSATFKEWKYFVEGVNDLIKRKNTHALQKIQLALATIDESKDKKHPEYLQNQKFKKDLYPYAAYAFYINDYFSQAINIYNKSLQLINKPTVKYAKHICQGLFLHKMRQYETAIQCFLQGFNIQKRIEPLFMLCISQISKYKQSNGNKQQTMQEIQNYIKFSKDITIKSSLFLFYISLIYLYIGKSCIQIIEEAISLCEEPMSEYYFVQALALQNESRMHEAIKSICRAIQLDYGIAQFYRERSKYYFLVEQYLLAIEDCKTAESMAPEDEEIPLLLAFYYYLSEEYVASFNYIQNVKPLTGKLRQFQQALQLRLGLYNELQQIGELLNAFKSQTEIKLSSLNALEVYILNRHQYSQFSVYFYHLILAYGYARNQSFQKSLNHLFGCLEEIQFLVDERQAKLVAYDVTWEETEQMLDEVKFNIVIVCLLKESKAQAQKFINSFILETQSKDLKESFEILLNLINSKDEEGEECKLIADNDFSRLSDNFPQFTIALNNHKTLITQFLISYPVKLKFTIAPEFDASYLFNFVIDKIDHKIPPPWLKNPMNNLHFTNSIRNESVRLSESFVSSVKEQRQSQERQQFFEIKEKLKLNKSIEQKLNKIIMKQRREILQK